jgi:putative ABC transport system substrate-binding protein
MKRRACIALAAGTASAITWRRVVGQQAALPVIGFLGGTAPLPGVTSPFLEGLARGGFVVGRNVAIEYRWAENHPERLPALVAELLRIPVAVIVAISGLPTRAAKDATTSVPVVFEVGRDPVEAGLVASLGRPGGNLTGVHLFTADLNAKRFGLLFEMVPRATTIAALVNPKGLGAQGVEDEIRRAAAAVGVATFIVHATTERELEVAFATARDRRAGALIVGNDPYFNSRREALVALAKRHALPAIYEWREYVAQGGLMSYGTDFPSVFRQLGTYTARVLKGEKPGDLPVAQPTKFELVINRKTAKALGLTIPQSLLLRADEVIQ